VQVHTWGIGIPAANQTRLAAAFHSGSNVGMIPAAGRGVSTIGAVDRHGGIIAATSKVGAGTPFTVCLRMQQNGGEREG
jgi:signal transduction histidine kinase